MSLGCITETATGVITVDLDQIAANWRAVAELVAPAHCGAVVKANAYGLGAQRVIPALHAAGCRTFFVATPEEALEAQALAPKATLFLLDGLMPGTSDVCFKAEAVPVLASLAEIEEWSTVARARGARCPAALHIDSGLNRLGLSAHDVKTLANDTALLSGFDLKLVMSHLASADDPADPKNNEQRATFERLRRMLPPAPASLSASDGLMLGANYHFDLVRPGYALYGGQAFRGGATPVHPVVSVAVRVLQVREVAPGQTVGYSGTWMAERASRIAVLAGGYADGIARSLSSAEGHERGTVRIHSTLVPIVGRVSMDLITVDVTDVSAPVARGDLVELIGPGLTIEAMGTRAGTIGYEVLTRLGQRFHRVYVEGEAQGHA